MKHRNLHKNNQGKTLIVTTFFQNVTIVSCSLDFTQYLPQFWNTVEKHFSSYLTSDWMNYPCFPVENFWKKSAPFMNNQYKLCSEWNAFNNILPFECKNLFKTKCVNLMWSIFIPPKVCKKWKYFDKKQTDFKDLGKKLIII